MSAVPIIALAYAVIALLTGVFVVVTDSAWHCRPHFDWLVIILGSLFWPVFWAVGLYSWIEDRMTGD